MKKIPSLFLRDFSPGGNPALVTTEPNPACAWVFSGHGVPTRKRDGTAVHFMNGGLWRRYDAKQGKPTPPGFLPCQDPDPETGHYPGWVPIGPEDRWHLWAYYQHGPLPDGTYELCGPKVGDNAERLDEYVFFKHGVEKLYDMGRGPLMYDLLRDYFRVVEIEGIVWHHDDGRMAKLKRADFGFAWPVKG